jgi:hypothetical protein
MQKPTRLDDVRNDVLGLGEAMLAMFEALARSGAIPADEVEQVLEEMLSTINPRVHRHWREMLQDVQDERAKNAERIVAERIGRELDPLPDALQSRRPRHDESAKAGLIDRWAHRATSMSVVVARDGVRPSRVKISGRSSVREMPVPFSARIASSAGSCLPSRSSPWT